MTQHKRLQEKQRRKQMGQLVKLHISGNYTKLNNTLSRIWVSININSVYISVNPY